MSEPDTAVSKIQPLICYYVSPTCVSIAKRIYSLDDKPTSSSKALNAMKALVLFVPLITLSAFAAPSRIAPPVERVETARSYFLKPSIGESATAEVGDSLYQEGIRTVSRRFRATLKADVTSKMDNGYVLAAREGFQDDMMMRRDSGTPLLCFITKNTGIIGFFGDKNVKGCLVDSNKNQTFDRAMFEQFDAYFSLSNPVPYEIQVTDTVSESPDDFYVEVLYQGMSKGEVKISYREFSHGIARPAFTQDVSYELASDGTGVIGFKGLRIKVLKATGHDLQYVLEQPMPSLTKYRVEQKSGQ